MDAPGAFLYNRAWKWTDPGGTMCLNRPAQVGSKSFGSPNGGAKLYFFLATTTKRPLSTW